jgi:hypothetical protein
MPLWITTEAAAWSTGTPSARSRAALKGSPPSEAVGVSWFRASPPRRSQKRRIREVFSGRLMRMVFQETASSQFTRP